MLDYTWQGGEKKMVGDKQQKKEIEVPAEIKTFLQGILNDAGMTAVDDGTREEMIKELFARLDYYITSVIVDKMPAEHLDDFMSMVEKGVSMQEMETYIKDKVLNYQDVFSTAFAEFRDLYLGNVSAKRQAPQ